MSSRLQLQTFACNEAELFIRGLAVVKADSVAQVIVKQC